MGETAHLIRESSGWEHPAPPENQEEGPLIMLCEFLEKEMTLPFDNSATNMLSFGRLIRHHPDLQAEAAACQVLGEAVDVLTRAMNKCHNL